MPQSTNFNTPPYFEDYNPEDNFHKVLFKPGVPLQARELTTVQSILQNQIEKFGSSIYGEGSMVVPGQIGFDLYNYSVLIEDEYFGLPSSQLVDFIVGKTITGQISGVTAKVVNAITAEQSEKGYTTLFIKYISASSSNEDSKFIDDEILISNESFSIGNTVISENTDFAKCITENSTNIGSSAKINPGIYYAKGHFISVKEQEIILDQFGINPSYKIGLQVLETIVSSESDGRLNDPSQGYSNFAAPGADRFKLDAKLVKKSISDDSVTDFIELLRIENGKLKEIVTEDSNQVDRTLENTFARRTYDESGDYEIEPFTFSLEECLNDGTNNGVFEPLSTTNDGNVASKDLFEVVASAGKSYVRGFEIKNISNNYIDVKKSREFKEETDVITTTNFDGFTITLDNNVSYNDLNNTFQNNDRVVQLIDESDDAIGYAKLISVDGSVVKLYAITFLTFDKNLSNLKKIQIGSSYNFETNAVSGGTTYGITSTGGKSSVLFAPLIDDKVIKSVEDVTLYDIKGFATGILTNGITSLTGVKFNSNNFAEYQFIFDGSPTVGASPSVTVDLVAGTIDIDIDDSTFNGSFYVFGPQTIANPTETLISHDKMRVMRLRNIPTKYEYNNQKLSLGRTKVSKVHAVYIGTETDQDIIFPNILLNNPLSLLPGEIIVGADSSAKGRVISVSSNTVFFVYESDTIFIAGENITSLASNLSENIATVSVTNPNPVKEGNQNKKGKFRLNVGQTQNSFEYSSLIKKNLSFNIPPTRNSSEISSVAYENSTVYALGDFVLVGNNVYEVVTAGESATSGSGPTGTGTGINDGTVVFDFKVTEMPNYIWVVFDEFVDTISGTFSTANSYYNADFDDIPSYKFGRTKYYLSDLIDFRINQTPITVGSGTINTPFEINISSIIANTNLFNFGNTNFTNLPDNQVLASGYSITKKIEYYLSKTTDIYLSSDGEFEIKDKIESTAENGSTDINNCMKLLTLSIPAYTRNLNDIIIDRSTNKRYTMKDIGNLENRLDNVEYYTQLSLLETDTANLFIPDNGNLNRLKNGFIVDNFTSHELGDIENPSYRCAIDAELGELRSPHYTSNVPIKLKNIEKINNIKNNFLMLDYSDKKIISQPFASGVENVNPFAVISWVGEIKVQPSVDDWVDVTRVPEKTTIIEGDFTAQARFFGVSNLTNGGFGRTEWNNWQTQWTSRRSRTVHTREFLRPGRNRNRRVDTTTTTLTTRLTRSGVRARVTPRLDRTVLGDRIIDVKYARFKRSRNIRFDVSKVKPFVKLYPFLEGKDIYTLTTPKLVEIKMLSGEFTIGEDVQLVSNLNNKGRRFRATASRPNRYPTRDPNADRTLTINPYTRKPMETEYTSNSTILNFNVIKSAGYDRTTKTYNIKNGQGGYLLKNDKVVGLQSGAVAQVTNKRFVTTQNGELIAGIFFPDPSVSGNLRWKTGESIIKVTDSSTNSLIPGTVQSSAEGTFEASGTIQTKQQNVLLTRNARVRFDTVNQNRTIRRTNVTVRRGAWRDPLAQSFLVEETGGIFLSKIDTYFFSKDTAGLPVSMEIREMENGYPSPNILGEVTLIPDDVNVSSDATAVTTFTFDNPIYLKEYEEYCFVILTSSVEYRMWISTMGEIDINGNRITSQPYAGVLFKSQNASTWTANQLQDLKFNIYRAEFDTTSSSVYRFVPQNEDNSLTSNLGEDPIELNINSGYIKVNHENHGMHDPSSFVTISGVSSEQFGILGQDWTGLPGDSFSIKDTSGDNSIRNLFFNNNNINGNPPSSTNLSYIKINNSVYSYDASQTSAINNGTFPITVTSKISGDTPADGYKEISEWEIEPYIINGIPLTEINKTHRNLKWITLDSYQINLSNLIRNTPDNISVGGLNVIASQNIMYSQIMPQIAYDTYPGTSVTAKLKSTSATSIGNSSFSDPSNSIQPTDKSYIKDNKFENIELNENNYFSLPKLVTSQPNSLNLLQGEDSTEIRLTLSSELSNLSPVIDLERFSLITTINRIDNINENYKKAYFSDDSGTYNNIGSETLEDYNSSNYITKLVTLANPSTSLRIEFAAFNPGVGSDPSTNIDVYVKILSGEESDPESIKWGDVIVPSENSRSDTEYVDQRYDYSIPSSTPKFTSFQIKIRMRSKNQALVPLIKDLRCIALA